MKSALVRIILILLLLVSIPNQTFADPTGGLDSKSSCRSNALNQAITKFGFDPFMMDPKAKAYNEVNDLYTRNNMNMPGMHAQMTDDYNRLVAEYTNAKAGAMQYLQFLTSGCPQ